MRMRVRCSTGRVLPRSRTSTPSEPPAAPRPSRVSSDLGWPDSGWAIDAASVDGGLQLGILWASAHGHPLVLPIRIGRMVQHRPFGADDTLRCRLAAHPVSDKRIDFDIALETTDGALVAALEGVEFYAAGTRDESRERVRPGCDCRT